MALILLLDTSTSLLSVALSRDGKVVAQKVCKEPRQQASLTAPLVKEILDSQGLKVQDCDAICVSKGPGSYTGLRVGVSTAKGLAFGAGKPLLSVGTLDMLANQAPAGQWKYIVPMIDARRMEVYTAVFSPEGRQLTPVEARIIGPESFADELSQGPVVFIGDGALKCKDALTSANAHFVEDWPLAASMAEAAEKAYNEKRFEDLAYFEPFYLKDFVATVSRKQLW